MPNKCFNWFEPGDIGRGAGEALSIKQMVDNMKASHSTDSDRYLLHHQREKWITTKWARQRAYR